MAVNLSSIYNQLNLFDTGEKQPKQKRGYEPIQYSSLFTLYLLNYALLLLLLALPITIIIAILEY